MKLSQIKPNPKNPRLIKDERFEKLCKSIQEAPKFMALRPIIIDGEGMILGGNMRYKALLHLGYKEVPDAWVKRADDLTEDERRRFIISDNVGFGDWDWQAIGAEWDVEELADWGLDVPDFAADDVVAEAKEDDYEMPDTVLTDIVQGDLFEIGPHRLLCGSSTNSLDVYRLMADKCPDMVFTDPPYGMNAVSKSGVLSQRYKEDIIGDGDTSAAKDAFLLIYSMFPEALHIWWGANYYSSCLPDAECWLVWDKNNGASDQTDCELAWSNARSVVRQFTKASEKSNRVHPTQKPVELVAWAIERFGNNAKIICDYFVGSGSTMVAVHQLGRICYGMELDPKYCQVIVDRMLKLDPALEIKRNGQPYKKTDE